MTTTTIIHPTSVHHSFCQRATARLAANGPPWLGCNLSSRTGRGGQQPTLPAISAGLPVPAHAPHLSRKVVELSCMPTPKQYRQPESRGIAHRHQNRRVIAVRCWAASSQRVGGAPFTLFTHHLCCAASWPATCCIISSGHARVEAPGQLHLIRVVRQLYTSNGTAVSELLAERPCAIPLLSSLLIIILPTRFLHSSISSYIIARI